MTQAQRKLEQSARVRSVPPPLPRRNHGGPAISSSVPSIRPRVSTPPPPPPAAFRSSRPPRLSVPPAEPAMQLALLPQWEDANASLRPAPKKTKSALYWISSTTVSIAVGALVAASLMNMRSGDLAQILPSFHSESPRIEAPVAPEAPVRVAEVAQRPETQTAIAAATQPSVVIDELTVTTDKSKTSKPSKRAKPAARVSRRAAPPAAPPDPREETAAESVSEAETTPAVVATEAPAAPAEPVAVAETAAPNEAPAPEVTEPAAPALPEKLTRDQVRSGLDAMRAQVLQCANGTYGRVLADVTISAPGRVSNSVIEGTFAGTNAGSCMARVLRGAKFPAFSGEDISVRYPFSF